MECKPDQHLDDASPGNLRALPEHILALDAVKPVTSTTAAAVPIQKIVQFEGWLEETLAGEEVPPGIAADIIAEVEAQAEIGAEWAAVPGSDLYSLWEAMTALSQEVKLQGRAFKQLNETMEPVADLEPAIDWALKSHDEALAEAHRIAGEAAALRQEWERDLRQQVERAVRKEALDVLLDMRDRLERGRQTMRSQRDSLKTAASSRRGTWSKLFPASQKQLQQQTEAMAALEKGYLLSLGRLEEWLERYNVREIPCQGTPFDPRMMNAVDLVESRDVPEGTVLEVYRTGYEWQGEVYRTAQVKVACAPGAHRIPAPE